MIVFTLPLISKFSFILKHRFDLAAEAEGGMHG
jgi:hypothetical protein